MKKIYLIILLFFFIGEISFAQKLTEDKVPVNVKKEFLKKFPTAAKTKWEMEDGTYEVNFINNKKESSANFDKNGKWMESESEISENELPQTVKSSVNKNFAGYKIMEIAKIEKADKTISYEVELSKNKEKLDVLFSLKGDIIDKKDISKEKEEDND
jgi:hypothetical protein